MRHLNKSIILALAVCLNACNTGGSSSTSPSTSSSWSWVGGSNSSNAYGNYGNKGVPSTANIPGARDGGISWTDKNGNLWLFGGNGNASSGQSGNLNDLWEYNPKNKEWTWVSGANTIDSYAVYGTKGQAASDNIPGARFGGVSWVDNNNNLWLFGGFGNVENGVAGALNDLWKYNISNNEWTWVSGSNTINIDGVYGVKNIPNSNNIPGSRLGQIAWVDNDGNLWMFGGAKDLATRIVHNDLWKYNISNNEWTWISGEKITNQAGIYGVQGISATNNEPGSRLDTISWTDSSGNLWLFGGNGIDGVGTRGNLNDLWKYSPTNNQWTWMSGSIGRNSYSVYGKLGTSSPNSIPGAREHRIPLSWADNRGNLWMFGGFGYGANTRGELNDLWKYSPTNNQWTWMSGSIESNAYGVYNNTGILAFQNGPGARRDGVGFVDHNNLWIFGGSGNATSTNGNLNDLWKYSNINTTNP